MVLILNISGVFHCCFVRLQQKKTNSFIKQPQGGKKLSFELSCSNLDSSELCIFPPTVMLGGSRREGLEGRVILAASAACSHACGSGPFARTCPLSIWFLLRKCSQTSVRVLMDICETGSVLVLVCCATAKLSPPGGHYPACAAGRTHLGSWGHHYRSTWKTFTTCMKM